MHCPCSFLVCFRLTTKCIGIKFKTVFVAGVAGDVGAVVAFTAVKSIILLYSIVCVCVCVLLLLLLMVWCRSFEHVLLSLCESAVGAYDDFQSCCASLDAKYINFYSSLFRYLTLAAHCMRSIVGCVLLLFCVCSFFFSLSAAAAAAAWMVLLFCVHFICTWLHNNAQRHSPKIEYFAWMPGDWRAADGRSIIEKG